VESPPRTDAPRRLLAGLHYLVLTGRASWDDAVAALGAERDFLRRFVREQRIQTNEVQRSWTLLPCFLLAAERTGAERLDLIELGPSAGLNLVWDRYRYRFECGAWGPEGARLELAGEERGRVPARLLERTSQVRSRIGVDVAPLDLTRDDHVLLLKSFVWADQTWRLELLDRAVAALREDPPELVRGDAAEVLPALLERRRRGALTVVFQTAVLGYLPPERRRLVRSALAEAGAAGPLAYVSSSRPRDGADDFSGLAVRLWPGGERSVVAHADVHGAWIDWLGWEP
jgi:hypothetical protein